MKSRTQANGPSLRTSRRRILRIRLASRQPGCLEDSFGRRTVVAAKGARITNAISDSRPR